MALDSVVLGEGIYRPREAARLIGASTQEVLRWTRGSGPTAPIWKAHYQYLDDATEISFLDLVELRTVRALRIGGISLQAIRYAIQLAQIKFSIQRPLSTIQFKTDGHEILMDAVEKDDELVSLSKKRPTQKVFKRLVDQSVSDLEYEGSQILRWRPKSAEHVVIDPSRAFGSPLIDEVSISTEVLFKEWDRSKDYRFVGRLYDISEHLVRDAVRFEDRLSHNVRANSGKSLI